MLSGQQDETKLVRQFRQILLWLLQLAPIREGAQIQEHWSPGAQRAGNHWSEVRDAFSCDPGEFQQRHYSEFVTLCRTSGAFSTATPKAAAPAAANRRSAFPPHRRGQGAHDFSGLRGPGHVRRARRPCFFYDLDVVILVVEILARDLSLTLAQDTM